MNREELIKWISDNGRKIESATFKEIIRIQNDDPIILKFLAKYNVENFDLEIFIAVIPLLNNNDNEVPDILNSWLLSHAKKINSEIFINKILTLWNYNQDRQCQAAIMWIDANKDEQNVAENLKKIIIFCWKISRI